MMNLDTPEKFPALLIWLVLVYIPFTSAASFEVVPRLEDNSFRRRCLADGHFLPDIEPTWQRVHGLDERPRLRTGLKYRPVSFFVNRRRAILPRKRMHGHQWPNDENASKRTLPLSTFPVMKHHTTPPSVHSSSLQ